MKRTSPLLIGLAAASFAAAAPAQSESPGVLHAYYFGNSLTGNSMWGLHPELGATAGKTWKTDASTGAGWQVFQHWFEEFENPRKSGKPGPAASVMKEDKVDAIVIQAFGNSRLEEVTDSKYSGKYKLDAPTDLGDIRTSTDLAKLLLTHNPGGIVYLYSDWPGPERKLGPDGKPLKEKGPGDGAGFDWAPDRDGFDFSKAWDMKLEEMDTNSPMTAFRAYDEALLAGMAKNLPELAAAGRLRMIPVGDVLYALDKKIKAGQAPAGFPRIADFYTDTIHFRSGLPRYTVAATFFAALFQEDPAKLGWKLFNDPAHYKSKRNRASSGKQEPIYVHEADLGEHLAITPEHAAFLHTTIWDVVRNHPHTKIANNQPRNVAP